MIIKNSEMNQNIKINIDYPYLVIDNFFGKEDYKSIKKFFLDTINSLIDENYYNEYLSLNDKVLDFDPIKIIGGGHDRKSRDLILKIFENNEIFLSILNYFQSENFLNLIWEKFKKSKDVKKYLGLRSPRLIEPNQKISLFEYLLYKNYYINFKISRYTGNAGIGIHKDNNHKIMAFLFYFGYSDNQSRESNGTQLYSQNNNVSDCGDHTHIEHQDMTLLDDVLPVDNRMMVFFRTEKSWHGVIPPKNKLPLGVTRDALQINFMKCTQYKGLLSYLSNLNILLRKTIKIYR